MAGINVPAIVVDTISEEFFCVDCEVQIMIISNKQIQSVLKVYGEQNNAGKNTKTEKAQPAKGKDEVILSSGVQEFGQVLQRAITISDVRPERVQELSQKIQAGTYQVDSKDIADKMVGRILVDDLL